MFIRKEISLLKFYIYEICPVLENETMWGEYGIMEIKPWRVAGLYAHFNDSKPLF
jgi:hypothetical protein